MTAEDVRFFAERACRWEIAVTPTGRTRRDVSTRGGACVEVHEGPGRVRHIFADDGALLPTLADVLPDAAARHAERLLSTPISDGGPRAAEPLAEVAAASGRTVTWAGMRQLVVCGPPGRAVGDERITSTVEIEVGSAARTPLTLAAPWPVAGARPADVTMLRGLCARIDAWTRLPEADTVPSACHIGMPPGRAGAFFHELVGHPLEGDVVSSGTSYLQPLIGTPVAPPWLHVTDGAVHDLAGFRACVDDEGTPCGHARLVHAGVVQEPMTDLATAALAGWTPRGHGRRLDYRHPSVVRMTHTVAHVTPVTPPWRPRGDWIEAIGVELRSMALASGDFVFRIRLPLLHREDGTTVRLPPISLTGNGLDVLAQLQPGDPRVGAYFRATGGCGKLGQYPLPVSFANAGLWVPAGTVALAEAPDG